MAHSISEVKEQNCGVKRRFHSSAKVFYTDSYIIQCCERLQKTVFILGAGKDVLLRRSFR